MFDDKEKEDLKKLIQTGKRNGGRLSSMFLSNYFVGFPSEKQTEENYNIFKRINTGGLELTSQEIRHALYQGPATKLCKKIAKCKEFQIRAVAK